MKKILISAIEFSGDMHAANLISQIKKQYSKVRFVGLGSTHLVKEGARIIADVSLRSTIGVLEPLKHVIGYLRVLQKMTKIMDKERPDLLLCIDGQGFNLPLAAAAKKRRIPVVYYIAPQEWLWGTTEGGRKVAGLCDLIISIFPEEHNFYQKLGAHSVYNGHPLVDIAKSTKTRKQFLLKYNLTDQPILALFPGSRAQEIKMLLSLMLSAVKPWQNTHNIVVVAANPACRKIIKKQASGKKIILNDNYNAMASADLVITSTGTTTLECTLLGTPLIAIYRLSKLSYWVVTKIARIKLPRYKALPNMIAKRLIVPELIQEKCTVEIIQNEIRKSLKKAGLVRQELKQFRETLFKKSVLEKNAGEIIKLLVRK